MKAVSSKNYDDFLEGVETLCQYIIALESCNIIGEEAKNEVAEEISTHCHKLKKKIDGIMKSVINYINGV